MQPALDRIGQAEARAGLSRIEAPAAVHDPPLCSRVVCRRPHGHRLDAGQDGESQLIANKGLVSVSVNVRYGGAVAHPNSNSAAMAQVIRDVFSQLNV